MLTIADAEARRAARAAAKLTADAVNRAAPVGRTHRLSKSHKPRTGQTSQGIYATVRRDKPAWYGRVVEGGRKPGVSNRPGSRGRRYPGAPARPFSERAALSVQVEAERLIEAGADRVAEQLAARL